MTNYLQIILGLIAMLVGYWGIAQTCQSNGNINGSSAWNTSSNWSCASVPDESTTVQTGYQDGISVNFSDTISGFQTNGNESSFTVTNNSTFGITNNFILNSYISDLVIDEGSTLHIGGYLQTGTNNNCNVTVNGTLYVDSVSMNSFQSSITIGTNGLLVITNGFYMGSSNENDVIVNGELRMGSWQGTDSYNGTFQVNLGGEVTINGDADYGIDLIINTGGTINITGDLNLGGSPYHDNVTLSGDINVGGNMSVNDGVDVTIEGSVAVDGTLEITNENTAVSGGGTVSASSFDCSSDGGDASCDNNISTTTTLPVELIHFSARNKTNDVELTWITASETDNSHFVVERSIDGESFDPISTIYGQGTKLSTTQYKYEDKTPALGNNYYRLRQVDLDGTFEYSKKIKVVNRLEGKVRISPNPASSSSSLNITFNDEVKNLKMSIHDYSGHEVYSKSYKENVQRIDLSQLITSTGVFYVKLNLHEVYLVEKTCHNRLISIRS